MRPYAKCRIIDPGFKECEKAYGFNRGEHQLPNFFTMNFIQVRHIIPVRRTVLCKCRFPESGKSFRSPGKSIIIFR